MVAVVHGMLAHHRTPYKGGGNYRSRQAARSRGLFRSARICHSGRRVQSMENTMTTAVSLKPRANYKATIEQCLAEMQRLHEHMVRDQEDID